MSSSRKLFQSSKGNDAFKMSMRSAFQTSAKNNEPSTKSFRKSLADVVPGLGRFTYDASIGKVFITSGTGVVGYRVAASLLDAGHTNIRIGVFRGNRELGPGAGDPQNEFVNGLADILEERGAEIVDFDWTDASCYNDVLMGVSTVFCSLPNLDDWASVFPAFLLKCKAMKVEHFIKISFLNNQAGSAYRSKVPFVQFHATCDDLLEQAPSNSRISYTILCASHLMSTPLLHQGDTLRKEHKLVTASYGMGVNYVSPNDVAEAAVTVLLNRKEHRNKVYNLTGPGPITDAEVAKLLTKAFGTEITHVSLGYHDYVKDVKARGLPKWLVKDSATFEKIKASGVDELKTSYTKDVEKLTGRKPESFQGYLENKECQRPGMTFP